MYCVGSVSPELHNNTHFLLGTLQTDFSNALSLVQSVCLEIHDFVSMQYSMHARPDIYSIDRFFVSGYNQSRIIFITLENS